jgi:hypothetical protein
MDDSKLRRHRTWNFLALLCAALFASAAPAQIPPRIPPSEPQTIVLGPSEPIEAIRPNDEHRPDQAEQSPEISTLVRPPVRPGIFQRLIAHQSWLASGGAEEFGWFHWEVKSIWGLPLPDVQKPLVITPSFGTYWVDGPELIDLPPRLYDVSLQIRWLPSVAPRWKIDLGLTPGLYGDFEFCDSSTFRLASHAVAVFQWKPTLILSGGVAYLDREDVGLIPVAGVIWQLNERWILELLMPRPRINRRIDWGFLSRPGAENWLYVVGEFGGGTWSVERAVTSLHDVVTYRDFRLLVGVEQRVPLELSWRLEAGYVFSRKLEYESSPVSLHPDDTVVIRMTLSY